MFLQSFWRQSVDKGSLPELLRRFVISEVFVLTIKSNITGYEGINVLRAIKTTNENKPVIKLILHRDNIKKDRLWGTP